MGPAPESSAFAFPMSLEGGQNAFGTPRFHRLGGWPQRSTFTGHTEPVEGEGLAGGLAFRRAIHGRSCRLPLAAPVGATHWDEGQVPFQGGGAHS